MRNLFILIIALFALNYHLAAQSNNNYNYGKVTYERILNFDGSPKSSSFSLFFNPNFSVFYENRVETTDGPTLRPSSSNEFDLTFDVKFNGSKYIVLTDFEKDSILSQVSLFKDGKEKTYIVEEKKIKIKWDILNEYKTINDLKVQKAIGEFRGRHYIAWFSNEIPVKFGPWKLNGLPGLIIAISDDKNEVMFYAKTINIPLDSNLNTQDDFQFNKNFEKISLAEYVKMKGQQGEELKKLINSKLPRGSIIDMTNCKSNDIELEYECTSND
jgi:GLPGLI family protein